MRQGVMAKVREGIGLRIVVKGREGNRKGKEREGDDDGGAEDASGE
jgi:hypothetical protein